MVYTNPNYWDCNCTENYIHPKGYLMICPICGAIEEDQPDSIQEEIDMTER